MTSERNALNVWQQIWTELLVFLGRPSVQIQLAVVILAAIVAAIVGRRLRRAWQKKFGNEEHLTSLKWKLTYHLVYHATPGILFLVLLQLGKGALLVQGGRTGLVDAFMGVGFFYLGLEGVLALAYALGDSAAIRRYQGTLIVPLFTVVLGGNVLDIFFRNGQLLAAPVFVLFDSPISLSVLFLITVGFYLWIVGIHAVGQGIQYMAVHYGGADAGGTQAVLTLLRYLLIIIGLGYVLFRLNFNTTTIAAISGGLSVGVGFALSTILSNFASGILLLFERTLRPGDVIEVNGELGRVDSISIRAVRVRTLDDVEKIIPNSEFVTSSFTTYTGQRRRVRLQLPVGVSYDDAHRHVIDTLLSVAAASPNVMLQPSPEVHILNFGDFTIDYVLHVWIPNPLLSAKIKNELYQAMLDAFAEGGITIPYPRLVVEGPQGPTPTLEDAQGPAPSQE